MKKLFPFLIFVASTLTSRASVLQAVTNGAWTAIGTWSTSTVPANGDVVIIPAGMTVSITSNIVLNTQTIRLINYGTLYFNGGGASLSLGSASVVEVYTGGLITNGAGAGSHLINIGTNQVYKGTQGNISGPQLASSTTSGFQSFNPLPVKFVSFDVSLEGNAVLVQWTTADEADIARFEVERSADGTHWERICSVQPLGSWDATRDYSYQDMAAGAGFVFYRVKEIDMNGSFAYTAIKNIRTVLLNNTPIVLVPQGKGNLMVQFQKSPGEVVTVRIFSLSGQLMKQQRISNAGTAIMVNTSLHGNYIASVTGPNNLNVARQIVF